MLSPMCIIVLLAAIFPRTALVFLWFLEPGYLERAIEPWYWILLGFVFMPLTTLALAYGMNSLGSPGHLPPMGWLLVGLGAVADLGIIGGGSQGRRWRDE
jgi:hypothetical protein